VLVSGYVDEFEVKKEDGGDPSVDRGVRLDVGLAKHTFDVTCIHFDNEIADSDEMKAGGTERAEEPAVEFELRLGVTRLAFVPREGTEARWPATSIGTNLSEDPTYTTHGRIN
jgi:hypothetical protein